MSRFDPPRLFIIRVTIKTAAAILVILAAAALMSGIFRLSSQRETRSLVDDIRYCDSDYCECDYAGLYNTLALHGLYSDEFDKYWEAVHAYRAYTLALEWQTALDNGREGAGEKYDQALKELKEIEKNVRFSENGPAISGYLEEFEKIEKGSFHEIG